MPTPHDQAGPDRGPVLEPIRVLRPRRLDRLAELMREMEQDAARAKASPEPAGPDAFAGPSGPEPWAGPPAEDDTEELPRVFDTRPGPRPAASGGSSASGSSASGRSGSGRSGSGPFGFGPGLRRAAVAVAVTAAALVGFGCALLLPGRQDTASAAQPSSPATSVTPTEPAGATPTAAADPDGAGTLREGDSGPEVTELQERLLRIPDVYRDGSTGGRYDAELTAAVARFQLWYGIRGDEDGVYGDDTRRSLESRTSLTTG
ncbi:peptidoglycan-binding domain-containing protein [Streptomyces sp. NPDC004542]|uniref:peptidoglycan-binding domain-containing protein n=1 Tax=Streptomyces sp. NPDC004542 TaxID=3154281 RepID=UPI0033A00374